MGQHAVTELSRRLFEGGWAEIERGDQRKDDGAGIGSSIHVADVNFVQRRLTDAEHQGALLFETNVRGAFDEMRSDSVRDASQRADAARNDDHSVGWIRAAGDVGANIGICLRLNLAGRAPEDLADQVGAAFESEFLCQHTQCAVGGDEVHGLNA